jgi:PAS domain S-box-containing protein
MIELLLVWLPLLIITIVLSGYFLRLYLKDNDKRKLMFAIVYTLASISYLLYLFNIKLSEMQSYFLQNIYQWLTIPLILGIFIAVNEHFMRKKDFNLLFRIFLVAIFFSFILLFLPIQMDVIFTIIMQFMAIEIIAVLTYLLIRKRILTDLMFLLAIVCFTLAGISLSYDILLIFSVFSFIIGYVFLILVFIVATPSKDKKGVSSYFSLQHQLDMVNKELLTSEEKMHSILKMLPDNIMDLDHNGTINFMNHDLQGSSVNETIGKTVYDYTPIENHEIMKNAIEKVYTTKKQESFETPVNLPNGNQSWFLIRLSPIIQDGKVDHVMQIATDISEKKFAEKELEGKVVNLEKTELASLNIMEDMAETVENLKKAQNEISDKNKELKITNQDLNVAREQLSDLNANLEKKVEERTAEIQNLIKQKDEFVNQLGHDLKTPLGPLINLLPIVKKKNKDPKLKEILDISIQNVTYMKNMVKKTIELATLNSSKFNLKFEDFNLYSELEKINKKYSSIFKDNNIILKNNIEENIIIKADVIQINELLDNVINNAVKYSPKGGDILVNSKVENKDVVVSIKDPGIGMSEEHIKHVFDEFYKADWARHDFDSSGLGMSICKRIIDLHGGKIWVESDGLNKGTTIFFKIPKGINKIKRE